MKKMLMDDCFRADDIALIAFDADDTLWDCQGYFDSVEADYRRLLAPWGDGEEVSRRLFERESANMPLLGYGSKAFTISMLENAIDMAGEALPVDTTAKIISLGKRLMKMPATPLPGVRETLEELRGKWRYKMVVLTKGDSLEQQSKFLRSGLRTLFDDFMVVADKTTHEYERLCRQFDIGIAQLCMVGNSFKSDIKPVLQLGGYAVHVPFHLEWKHEQTVEEKHPRLKTIDSFDKLKEIL